MTAVLVLFVLFAMFGLGVGLGYLRAEAKFVLRRINLFEELANRVHAGEELTGSDFIDATRRHLD